MTSPYLVGGIPGVLRAEVWAKAGHGPPSFFLISRLSSFGWHMQGCQMRFVKIPAILSTAPDLRSIVIRKRHRENRDNQYCQATINNLPYFGWFVAFRCVRDVTIAPRIASTVANKLRWRNYPDKIHYKSHYDLRNSALVPFEVTANYFIFTIPASDTDFQNTGLLPAFTKLAVKYRPCRWNTGHLTTLDICSR